MRAGLAALVAVLVLGLLPMTQARTAQAQTEESAELDVTKVTPNVVEEDAPDEVVVQGTLTNTSDQAIDNVQARIQRGNPPASEPDVQGALRGEAATATEPEFTPIQERLEPGAETTVEIRIPLTGPNSLDLDEPGSYPLLVNVNGEPEGSSPSRIAEENFLLPVLSPPEGDSTPPPEPTPTSMLVPLVDYPRLERGNSPDNRAILSDDELSNDLAPGGRLYGLVEAVNDATDNGSPLGNALCFAIDPDLLATAQAMSESDGYLVRQPNGDTEPGIGGEAANLWLSKLREAVDGRCVIALPYADADVVAISRAGLPDVTRGSLDGSDLVGQILNDQETSVEPRPAVWPIDGALDQPAASQLPGVETALLDPQSMDTPAGTLAPARIRDTDLSAMPLDPLLTSALNPLYDSDQRVTGTSPPRSGAASAQDALGALTFRATLGSVPEATSIMAPPRRWNLSGEELSDLLDGMRQLAEADYIEPTALPSPDTPTLPEAELSYPSTAANAEIPRPVLGTLAQQNYKVGDLYRSSEEEPARAVPPASVTTPLRNGLLRATSSAWRGDPQAARNWVRLGGKAVRNTLSQVHIQEFQGKLALAASNTSLPLTVVNDLPVTVRVQLRVPPTPGVEVSDLGVLRIPANSRRQFWPEASVQRAGQFNIDVVATTESGTELGEPKRLRVDSSAYGPLIPAITITAGALLIVLSAIRIVRRTRSDSPVASGATTEQTDPVDMRLGDTGPVDTTDSTERDTGETNGDNGGTAGNGRNTD